MTKTTTQLLIGSEENNNNNNNKLSNQVTNSHQSIHIEQILEGQKETRVELKKGFFVLYQQNQEIQMLNDNLNKKLEVLVEELRMVKKERSEKERRKNSYRQRKRLPKRDPIDCETYKLLIEASIGPGYVATRTRIALLLLTVTGIRVSELRELKTGQLDTLLDEGWIAVSRLKRGPGSHKAFLTQQGRSLVFARRADFQSISLMKNKDSYIFTSDKNRDRVLRRETLTNNVNAITRLVSEQLPNKPNISSHSFRVGYITKLWRDTKDIEFVRQTIGHRSIATTSQYVETVSDKERQDIITKLD